MDRTHGPGTPQGTSQGWAGEEAGKLFWTPILEGGSQAQPGVGMGRIVRGPQELPAGRGLSLPYPPHRNPSPHSPNVVGPQRDLQFPEHLRGLLNSPLKLGAKHRGTLVGGARASANRACPPPTTGLSRSAAPTTSIQLPGRKSILRPHILPLHTHTGCTPHGHVQTQKRHTNASLHTHTHTHADKGYAHIQT